MPQKSPKNKHANDNTPVIRTPEGDEILITAGRKLQQIRAFARNPDISDAQFRALVCIVDRLNEGKKGTDEFLWGSAYPTPETLAADMAKDERAARRIVKELRDGQRETRSKSGVKSLVPCQAVLSVENRKTADGHDDFNLIRLRSWDAFAVSDRKLHHQAGGGDLSNRSAGEHEQQAGGGHLSNDGGHLSDTDRSLVEDEQVTAPNSSQLLTPKTQPIDPAQAAPACDERGPAVSGSLDGAGTKPKAANNDSQFQPADYNWPDDWSDQFWKAFPVRKNVLDAEAKLASIAKIGIELEDVLIAARRLDKTITEKKYCPNPTKWMSDEPWKDNAKQAMKNNRPHDAWAGVKGKRMTAI